MNVNAVLYFVKYPTPGKVKTRLAKTIGEARAADLYRQLVEDNFSVLRECQSADLIVVFDPPEDVEKIKQWLPQASRYIPQEGSGLGERLTRAFQWAFGQGYKQAAAFGSDTLHLTATIVEQGFAALADADVVIGPAQDGGYYLIGTNSFQPELFQGISWSTGAVLQQTYGHISRSGLSHQILIPLEDLDEMKRGEYYEPIDH